MGPEVPYVCPVRLGSWSVGVPMTMAVFAAGMAVGACGGAQADHLKKGSRATTVMLSLRPPPGTPVLRVGGDQRAPAIPPGFIGLSTEFSALPPYAGHDPGAVDPVFEQLIRNRAGTTAGV